MIKFFQVPKTREEWLHEPSKKEWLKKYDSEDRYYGYIISKIPSELFEKLYQEKSKELMTYTISDWDYSKIGTWWEKWQRGTVGWWNYLNQFLGKKNELIPDVDELTLYRGLCFKKTKDTWVSSTGSYAQIFSTIITNKGEIPITQLKVGDKVKCAKPSWSLYKDIAVMFATGKQGYGDGRQMMDDEIGVVLKHTFKASELFLDTNWVTNNKRLGGNVVLGGEMEVIIQPKNRFVEVIEIFTKDQYKFTGYKSDM